MTKEEATNAQHRCLDLQYQLDDAYSKIERLRSKIRKVIDTFSDCWKLRNEQAARIKELEYELENNYNDDIFNNLINLLVEERARGNHYGMSYEEAVSPDPIERWIINGEIDAPKIYIDRVRDEARRQLVTEGKIGTGDHIVGPNQLIWQITEKRKNALRFSISGEMSPTCSCKYCKDAIATIRAMLRGTE